MQVNNYKHITTAGTYELVASSPGVSMNCYLEAVFINTAAGSANSITVQDGLGNTVAVRDGTQLGGKFDPDLALNGLVVIVGSGPGDITVVWQ